MAPQPVTERWQLLKAIFQTAASLPPTQQRAYLDAACAGDPALRAEAEALLQADKPEEGTQTFLSTGVIPKLLPDSLAGQRLGAYEILHEIGQGGMSIVYAAARVDQQFQKIVAVKVVKRGLAFEEIVRRFHHERQLLASLEHPYIARLLDGGVTEEELPYLVMEYVEGIPIDRYADSNNLSVPERLALFRSVCSAVQYAHQNLVVHRDLKPENILVTAKGTPKLLDFGIAKLLRPDYYGQTPNVTLPSVQPLTPEYASPEQIRGEPVTTASDIYSLGVLLYLLLAGRHPFAGRASSPATLVKAILEEEPPRPSLVALPTTESGPAATKRDRLHRQLRGDLDTIVLMALRKEPQRRYRSVEHLAEDLARHLQGQPVSARKDTAWYRSSKFVRRHKAGTAAATAAVVALLASSAFAIHSAASARQERATAERRFQEGREFSRFVLLELDGDIQSSPTSARKKMVQRALQYLNGLEKESGGDPSLQHDLVEGYCRVGDVQGDPFAANLGDSAGVRKSYETALAIADKMAAAHPRESGVWHDVARANAKLANLLSVGGDRQEALQRYERAKTILEPMAISDLKAKRDLQEVLARIGFAHLQMGNARASLASYVRYLQIAQELASGAPNPESRRAVAYGYERVGYLMARTGEVSEGLEKLRRALGIYQELAAADPENGSAQRDLASTYADIGDVIARGSPGDAAEDYREALRITESLAKADPDNKQYRRDHAVWLARLADAFARSGRLQEARMFQDRGLRLLKAFVESPNSSHYELQTYCSLLLTKPVTDPRKAEEALHYAKRLAAMTRENDPSDLHFLAQAQDATGDSRAAVLTQQKALALLPRDGEFDSRSDMEQELARFRRHAAPQK